MKSDDKALPESSDGVSSSDKSRGYSDASAADVHSDTAICNCPMCCAERAPGGFLGRPQGWER